MFFFVCTIVVVCMFAVRWWMFYAYTLLAMRIHCFFFLSKRQTCDMHGWLCVCVPFIRPLDTGLLHLQIYASHATEIYRTSFILSHMFSKYISPENNNKRTNERMKHTELLWHTNFKPDMAVHLNKSKKTHSFVWMINTVKFAKHEKLTSFIVFLNSFYNSNWMDVDNSY